LSDPLSRARGVKDQLRDRLADDPRVLGVGLAPRPNGFAVRVLVADLAAAADLGLPPEIDGVAVDVNPVGEIHAQD
jgi:hypothetical protein